MLIQLGLLDVMVHLYLPSVHTRADCSVAPILPNSALAPWQMAFFHVLLYLNWSL